MALAPVSDPADRWDRMAGSHAKAVGPVAQRGRWAALRLPQPKTIRYRVGDLEGFVASRVRTSTDDG